MSKKRDIIFFEHTADVEYEAYGESLEEAFEKAAIAMQNVMTDLKRVEAKVEMEIEAKGEDLESLLYDFLEKILILNDSENLVFSQVKVLEISQKNGGFLLKAKLAGEKFNPEKHESWTAIKAITYHNMKVGKKNEEFFVHVVLDI